jgi:hypothetical protein
MSFSEVKAIAFSGEYATLPHNRGLRPGRILEFFNDSARNLIDRRDILPTFDKLIHANGICFTGVWRIDRPSPYTGYFAQGSEGLVIVRCSVAGNKLNANRKRAFGIAGKVYPTMDPDLTVMPGNFVTVNALSGARTKHITSIDVTNMPPVGPSPAANVVNRVIFRLMDTRPGYRQLHPVSTLGVPPGGQVVTPDLMCLSVAPGTKRVDADDFRDELRLEHYEGHRLVYEVKIRNFGEEAWTTIGSMELTDYSISEGGDKRLHFWIPRDKAYRGVEVGNVFRSGPVSRR